MLSYNAYMINSTYWSWFIYYGVMIGLIILLHWRTHPDLNDWKRFVLVGLVFVIPYEIINIIGISVFNLWQNNADSPLPTLFGSPLETIPFAFLGGVLVLMALQLSSTWKRKGILWLILAFLATLQAYLSTLFGFLTWLNWNILASFLLWVSFIGILVGIEFLIQMYTYKKDEG